MGPLVIGINEMVHDFIAHLCHRTSIPSESLHIAYLTIAQGGLILMDSHSRAISDFVLTMSRVIQYAERGIPCSASRPHHVLCPTLLNLFLGGDDSVGSDILRRFLSIRPNVSRASTNKDCINPVDYFLAHGSFNSARGTNYDRKPAPIAAPPSIFSTARPSLRHSLSSEILISSSSYPIIGMSRCIPAHRMSNDLFLINLKIELHLELFHPASRPGWPFGKVINVFSLHTYGCRCASKKGMHDRIRDDTTAPLYTLPCR